MVEEWVVTIGFNYKKNSRNSLTLLVQQSHGQLDKVVPQKTKGTKSKQGGAFSSNFVEQSNKKKMLDVQWVSLGKKSP
jgi:hypothetical protein